MSAENTASAPPEAIPLKVSPLEQFVENNLKTIILGVSLLAVAAVGVGIARYYSHQAEVEAAQQFTSATSIEDCDKVVAHNPGSVAAGNALILKAQLQWTEGKKESSAETLKTFVKNYSSHPLIAQVQLGLATKQESLGDKAGAKQTLEAVVKNSANTETAPAAQIRLGDLAWADDKQDEAKKTLDGIAKTYPGKMDPFMDQIRQRTEIMAAGLPTKEVDGPPPAPKPVTPPPSAPHLEIPGLNAPMAQPKIDLTPPPAPTLPASTAPVAKPEAAPATAAPAPAPAPQAPTPAAPIPAPATPAPTPAATPAPAAPEAPTKP